MRTPRINWEADNGALATLRAMRARGAMMSEIAGEIKTTVKSVEGAIRRHDVELGKRPDSPTVAVALKQAQRTMHALWQPPQETLAKLREGLLADLRAEAATRGRPRVHSKRPKTPQAEQHLLEIAPVDLHLGKLAWPDETGDAAYDVSIAEAVFTDAIDDILARVEGLSVEQVVLVIGNDLLQTDTLAGTTTSGTYVDTDSRFIRSFRRAFAIQRWAADRCAEIAPTRLVIVPGNHDRQSAFTLGHSLESWYHDNAAVTVDNDPRLRKYLRYGISLLGWTHGSEEKIADLPLVMATEEKTAWAETVHREWHIGHTHKAKEMRFTAGDSFNGVRVRVLPSLCSPDAWHYAKSYVGERRACEAYIWSRTRGYSGHLSSNVLPGNSAGRSDHAA